MKTLWTALALVILGLVVAYVARVAAYFFAYLALASGRPELARRARRFVPGATRSIEEDRAEMAATMGPERFAALDARLWGGWKKLWRK